LLFLAIGLYLGVTIKPELFIRFGSFGVLFGVVSEYALIKNELNQLYSRLEGMGEMQDG